MFLFEIIKQFHLVENYNIFGILQKLEFLRLFLSFIYIQ